MIKECLYCGKEFNKKHNRHMYCSRKCADGAKHERVYPNRTPEQKERKREIGRKYEAESRDTKEHYKKNIKYYKQYAEEHPRPKQNYCVVHFKICIITGELFTTRSSLALYSKYGWDLILEARGIKTNISESERKEKEYKSKELVCKECGIIFNTTFKSQRMKYCSYKCAKKYRKRIQHGKERARLRKVKVETINPIKVFKRDKWKCQGCGIKTQKKYILMDNAAEMDHIIPLSKGGEHSYLNTQCLCRKCNREKSDKIEGQLLLVM